MKDSLTKFAKLSIFASIATIALKMVAYLLTNSVGLLSDALESVVNLVAAVLTLILLSLAEKPADEQHTYGHTKAEYFSSVIEGALIITAALVISYTAIARFINPKLVEQAYLGITISTISTLINLFVAQTLLKIGKKYRSISLEADGQHLMTDVWTSVGVVGGVLLVAFTGWQRLDPIIALGVAFNIIWTGSNIMKRSLLGLMDTALPEDDRKVINGVLDAFIKRGVQFHGMRSRQSGSRRFISFHVLVPGSWTVMKGHATLEEIEAAIRKALPKITIFTHLEPNNDPRSYRDITLDRDSA